VIIFLRESKIVGKKGLDRLQTYKQIKAEREREKGTETKTRVVDKWTQRQCQSVCVRAR